MKDYNQRKKRQILDTAIRLFQETHYINKVSVENIASVAGVSPTTIYNNFGTRETLVYEVVKTLIRDNLKHNTDLIRSGLSFPQKLTSIISGKLDIMSEVNGEIIKRIVSQDKNISGFIDELYQDEIRPLWLEMLAEGKQQGYVEPSLSEDALLIYIDVVKTGFGANNKLINQIAENQDLMLQLVHIFFYGFLKKEIDPFPKEE